MEDDGSGTIVKKDPSRELKGKKEFVEKKLQSNTESAGGVGEMLES